MRDLGGFGFDVLEVLAHRGSISKARAGTISSLRSECHCTSSRSNATAAAATNTAPAMDENREAANV